jgi:cellulose synthase operon protein C
MKHLLACTVVACFAFSAHAGGSLKEARQALLKGNYAEAQEIYETLAKDPKQRAAASIGWSRALVAEGEYDKAGKVIAAALKAEPGHLDLLARKAELLHLRGQWGEAEKLADQVIDKKDDHFLARYVRALVQRDRGNLARADDSFRWFVRTYTQRYDEDKGFTDPDELYLVGLAATEYARYRHLTDQFEHIVNELYPDLLKLDKLYWRAEFERGRLFAEKHNQRDAEKAFTRVLTMNPRAAEVFVAKGEAALRRMEIKDAELFAEQALQVNPKLPGALRLKADVHLFSGELDQALKDIAAAQEVNPRDESTLALYAATLHAQRKTKEFDKVLKDVEEFNPRAGFFYAELAERLDNRKLYYDAEKYFKRSVELQPKMFWGLVGLGQLYMRLGREDEARELLEKAFDADNFNVRVSNTLRVLDHLDKYQTVKTEHFILKFDAKNDKILANFMVKYLEDIYGELAKKFDYRPKGPFLIEVFNKHEMFSGRVVSLPDLHTIGACTGRMVAMVSTRDTSKVINKPFNWNRVLRHELVHVFNLDQTGFQIPHWFTEGLAVMMEGTGLPPEWNYLLTQKVRTDDVLNLDNILLAFVRPRTPDQWQQAYLQSHLYVEYLVQTHGEPAIGKLLAAYAEGLETDAALSKAIGTKKADFEKGYRKFLEDRVAKLGLKTVHKQLTFRELKDAHAKAPDDADLAARFADMQLSRGDAKEAQRLAAYVKAMVLLQEQDPELAYATLETAVDAHPTDSKAIKLLAKMHLEKKKFEAAAKVLEKGRELEPHDVSWLTQLAKAYSQTKDEAKLTGVLTDLAGANFDDLSIRRKLAEIHAKNGNHAEAERWARAALEIDVLDEDSQKMMIEALQAQGKNAELAEIKTLLERE